jgi:hypothetical protein
MIYVTWKEDTFVKDILDGFPFLRTLFDIGPSTIPYISEYVVSVDSYPPGSVTVDLTITNSNGNVTYYDPIPARDIKFEITNFPGPVITLGINTFKCSFYDDDNQIIDTIERKFDCRYILSILTWIAWSSEDVYKELLTYMDWMALATVPADGLDKRFGFLLNQPFYINANQYRDIMKGLFKGNVYGGSLKGLKSVLDGIKDAFAGSDYDLIDPRKQTLWRLPDKSSTYNRYFTKYSDIQLDDYYVQVSPGIYSDENPDRIHYKLKKPDGSYTLKANEEIIMLLSYSIKLVGYIVKFYDLKQFVSIQFDTPVSITDTFSFNTNLPCIIKGIIVGGTNYPRLLKKIDDLWDVVDNSHWSIVGRSIIRVDSTLQNSTLKFEGYTIPFDVIDNNINSVKSILTRICRIYYKGRNQPVFEIYTRG